MNSKKIMIYSLVVLAAVILLKVLVAISWKLIMLSITGLGLWLLFDNIIRPKFLKGKH